MVPTDAPTGRPGGPALHRATLLGWVDATTEAVRVVDRYSTVEHSFKYNWQIFLYPDSFRASMAKVLTTEADGDIGLGAIEALHRRGHEVVAVTVSPVSAGLYEAESGYTVPPPQHDEWEHAMVELAERESVDAVVPLGDPELHQLDRLRPLLPDDVPLIAPAQHAIDVSIDKHRTMSFFEDTDVAVPETHLLSEVDLDDLGPYPLVLKPRDGGGRYAVERAEDRADVDGYLETTARSREEILAQEYVDGDEYTTNVSVLGDGTIASIVTKQALREHVMGHMAWGTTCDPPPVRESARRVVELLDTTGPVNVQHVVSDGTAYLIEINPRFSGSSCFNAVAGVNEHDMLVRDALGEDVTVPDGFRTDLYMIRHLEQVYIDEDELKSKYSDDVDVFGWRDEYHEWVWR